MSIFLRDPKTVEFDWHRHLEQCVRCRIVESERSLGHDVEMSEANTRREHYDRVKWLAEKYPMTCAVCGKDLEDSPLLKWCYHVNDGVMCRSTKFYSRAHQPRPA